MDYKQLPIETPQGGIFKPFLFNAPIENIVKLALPRNTKMFIFTDDMTLIISRGNQKV